MIKLKNILAFLLIVNYDLNVCAIRPLLLISLDGMRADKFDEYLEANPTSNFKTKIIDKGLKADYMIPSFPTQTFPNHWTLVTGNLKKASSIL